MTSLRKTNYKFSGLIIKFGERQLKNYKSNYLSLIIKFSFVFLLYTCSESDINSEQVEMEKGEWRGFQMETIHLKAEDGEKIPMIVIKPDESSQPSPLVLLIHGMTTSKEWFTGDDIADHSDVLTQKLLLAGYTVAASDLRMHGEHAKEYPDFESFQADVVANWDSMFSLSLSDLNICLEYLSVREDIKEDHIGVFGTSLGGMFAYSLTVNSSEIIRTAVSSVCVFIFPEEYDPAPMGSPINLVDKIYQPVLMLAAINDSSQYNCIENADILYEMIPSENKMLLKFESGHTLPLDYVSEVLSWYGNYLE